MDYVTIYLDEHFTKAALCSLKNQIPPQYRFYETKGDGSDAFVPDVGLRFEYRERPSPLPSRELTPEEQEEEDMKADYYESTENA